VRARLTALLMRIGPAPPAEDVMAWSAVLGTVLIGPLGKVEREGEDEARSREWLREWRWDRVLAGTLRDLGAPAWDATQTVGMTEALMSCSRRFRAAALDEGGAR